MAKFEVEMEWGVYTRLVGSGEEREVCTEYYFRVKGSIGTVRGSKWFESSHFVLNSIPLMFKNDLYGFRAYLLRSVDEYLLYRLRSAFASEDKELPLLIMPTKTIVKALLEEEGGVWSGLFKQIGGTDGDI